MPSLCDANFLIALCYDRHVGHAAVQTWISATHQEKSLVLCRITQLSLLRLLSNASVMAEDVLSSRQAWSTYDDLMQDQRFIYLDEPRNLDSALRKFTQHQLPSPKVWQDAYLAAFAIQHGFDLVTFDKGFKQYAGLKVTLLRS